MSEPHSIKIPARRIRKIAIPDILYVICQKDIETGEVWRIKIGVTSDLDQRFRSICSNSSDECEIHFSAALNVPEDTKRVETFLLGRLRYWSTNNEWFKLPPDEAVIAFERFCAENRIGYKLVPHLGKDYGRRKRGLVSPVRELLPPALPSVSGTSPW